MTAQASRSPQPVDFPALAVEGVQGLTPYQPGKPIDELKRELGIETVVKLASNENPLGPGERALAAMRAACAEVHRYPDPNGFDLKAGLSRHLDVGAERLVLGNGSNDLLDLLARVFLGPGRSAVFSEHAFAVYRLVTRACGAEGRAAPALGAESGMPRGHDLEAMRARIDATTRVVFVANPNNPTGTWVEPAELEAFIADLPAEVVVVVDEAYVEYARDPGQPTALDWLERFPNLVVTRTFSKIHGLAGVRIGYAVAHPAIADLMNRVRHPFNANRVGQAGALAALEDADYVAESRRMNLAERDRLEAALDRLGLAHLPSATNFVTAEVGEDAGGIYQRLLERGFIARPLVGDGLPRHLRISVGTPAENAGLIAALEAVLEAR